MKLLTAMEEKLLQAVANENVPLIKKIIVAHPDINLTSAFRTAVDNENVAVTEFFLTLDPKRISPDIIDECLSKAIKEKELGICQVLLRYVENDEDAIRVAVETKNLVVLQFMHTEGKLKWIDDQTLSAATHSRRMLKYLVTVKEWAGYELIKAAQKALELGHMKALKFLLGQAEGTSEVEHDTLCDLHYYD